MAKAAFRVPAAALALTLALTACGGAKSAPAAVGTGGGEAAKAPVKIGFVNPLSGDSATYGQMGKRSWELAIEEINAKGGAGGHKLDVSYQDDNGDPKQAVATTQKFGDDKSILVISGSSLSSNTLAMVPILEKAHLSTVVFSSSTPKLSGMTPYFFRIASQDAEMGKIMANWAINIKKAKKIASVYVNNDYGNLLGQTFAEQVKAQGSSLVDQQTYLATDRDYAAILTNIKAKNPDVIGLCSTYTDAALIVKQARAMGITAAFVGPTGLGSAKFIEIAGKDAAEGVVAAASYSAENDSPKSQDFTKKFRAKYNMDPDHYAALAYDAIYVIADAIARADKAGELTRDGVQKALAAAQFDGLTGKVTFDSKGEWVRPYLSITVHDGAFHLQK